MVADLLGFCKAPWNDEIALKHFFFLAFLFHLCCMEVFFFRQALAGIFFSKSPTPTLKELNGRPLNIRRSILLAKCRARGPMGEKRHRFLSTWRQSNAPSNASRVSRVSAPLIFFSALHLTDISLSEQFRPKVCEIPVT